MKKNYVYVITVMNGEFYRVTSTLSKAIDTLMEYLEDEAIYFDKAELMKEAKARSGKKYDLLISEEYDGGTVDIIETVMD